MVHYCMKPEHDILLQCILNIAEMLGFYMGGMWKCCLEQNSVIFQLKIKYCSRGNKFYSGFTSDPFVKTLLMCQLYHSAF